MSPAFLVLALGLSAAPPSPTEPLRSWLVQCGAELSAAPPTFSPAALEQMLSGALSPPDGWRRESLPAELPVGTCWLVTRAPQAESARGLWLGTLPAARSVWLDGEFLFRYGRESHPYTRATPGVPGGLLPGATLGAEAPRMLAMRLVSRYVDTSVSAPLWMTPAEFIRTADDFPVPGRITHGILTLLALAAVAALVLFGVYRQRMLAYFAAGAAGCWGLTLTVTPGTLPVDEAILMRFSVVGIYASYLFFALFFQHLYGLQVHRLFNRGIPMLVGLVALLAAVLPTAQAIALIPLGMPVYLPAAFYWLYLNIRAFRAGNELARSVIWGCAAFFGALVMDLVSYARAGGGGEVIQTVFPIGNAIFVGSIVVAIARRFMKLSNESRGMLAQLQGAASELGTLVTQLQSAATQLSSATAAQVTALTETATTTTEMNQTSALSASRAAELIQQGVAVASVVDDGRHAADGSRSAIQEISGSLSTVASASAELSERVQRIDRIIDTVSFLADQSAALAINASIEASRAGEAGQGFAAVAREVRALANDSRRATAEVREVLDEIRTRTLAVKAQVSRGEQVVQGGVQQISRLAEVVGTLGGTIESAVGLMRQVEASARQNQAGVEQVLAAVTNIQRASESIRDGAETLTSLSRKASTLSNGLVQSTPAPTANR